MGFFSWDCKKCGKSIRSEYAVTKKTSWMTKAVVLTENGSIIKGDYDGYGRLFSNDGEFEIEENDPCIYHERCWKEDGKPDYTEPSTRSRDQGFFVNDD